MPSPIIHVSTGLAGAYFLNRNLRSRPETWKLMAFSLFFSMLPDADVIVGILAGDLGHYHNQITHSPLAGLILGLLLAWPWRFVFKNKRYSYLASRAVLLYWIHLGLDYLTYGRGLKLLWPFSDERFIAPVQPFIGVRWSEGLFALDHFKTAANELIIVAIAVSTYLLIRKLGGNRRTHGSRPENA